MEDLQRKARLLENEIDARLISLNKFSSTNPGWLFQWHQIIVVHFLAQTGYNPQMNVHGKRSLFDSLANEIESKLTKLSEINDAVSF